MPNQLTPAEQTEKYNLAVGQFVGNYRIERLLEEGGMGAIFVAVHKDIGRRAAVKVLMRAYARDPEFAARFLNEARAVNLIGHPSIVEVFEFGRLSDDTPYIIMEFLNGESLQARISNGKPRDFRQSLEWCRQIALGLSAAHKNGVIHRDLKPQNVFLIPDPLSPTAERIKILDFGIAKLQPEGPGKGASLTRTGATMGSPLYMAPEQCYEMGTVTDRADVYGLGILLYELLTGRPPFVSDMPAEVMVMQVKHAPPPLRSLNPAVPPPLSALVDAMLLKDPTQRPSMDEVAQRLERMLSGSGLTGGWQRVPGQGGRLGGSRVVLLGSVAALLFGAVAVGTSLLRRAERGNPARPPAFEKLDKKTPEVKPKVEEKPPPPATVHYRLSSEPPGARVFDLDTEQELGTTPVTLELTRSERPQRLTLRRPGFQDRSFAVERTADGSADQHLVPLPPRRPRPPATPKKQEELLTPNF